MDADRILHSRAYTRYIDKTQVFYLISHEHISHRVLHVQLLSKIARTIGKFLRLNEDLLEAIALGHDIGHPPFGHDGERILSDLCQAHGIGPFLHSLQGVWFLDRLEKQGRGLNLSLQVLDGILCHDGETHLERLSPQGDKTFASLEAEIQAKLADPAASLKPMTLEGCVVRLADTISYIGRDLEDAITLKLLRREELPPEVAQNLGRTNGAIVYSLVADLITHSYDKNYVGYSPEVGGLLKSSRSSITGGFTTTPVSRPRPPRSRPCSTGCSSGFWRIWRRAGKIRPSGWIFWPPWTLVTGSRTGRRKSSGISWPP